jgi:hypothetical protein
MPRTAFWVAGTAIASLLGGCAGTYIGTGYATVPLQIVASNQGRFEILDRPELGRVAISPVADQATRLVDIEAYLHKAVDRDPVATNSSTSPGSAYVEPLMQYFTQTGRSCRLIRGEPLVRPQWEFVYDCAPGFDASAITWSPSGYSNAPLPPPPRCGDAAQCAPR